MTFSGNYQLARIENPSVGGSPRPPTCPTVRRACLTDPCPSVGGEALDGWAQPEAGSGAAQPQSLRISNPGSFPRPDWRSAQAGNGEDCSKSPRHRNRNCQWKMPFQRSLSFQANAGNIDFAVLRLGSDICIFAVSGKYESKCPSTFRKDLMSSI